MRKCKDTLFLININPLSKFFFSQPPQRDFFQFCFRSLKTLFFSGSSDAMYACSSQAATASSHHSLDQEVRVEVPTSQLLELLGSHILDGIKKVERKLITDKI